ncbi:transcription elongation factor A protein 3 isoform X2 [Kryptolebias marmoratus]|uniref:transcription elongation factor A protein 3 isoform X2 n=1 Tax=Kryptolebias marmoratus TaxID=37003 RepID=UPI0018ACC5F7|nr:transcription elongation factor A protein 3 isoform X2 [Kryptolebias marmoratus]
MTREEDLIRIAKKLDKMVSRSNTEGAMDLLKELRDFNMTLKLLQETRIGMSVNNIRKHCTDEEVIALAKVLIKDWKRLLNSGQSRSEKETEVKNGLDAGAAAPNMSPSETRSRGLDVKLKHDSDSDKKHSDKSRKETQDDNHIGKKRPADEPRGDGKQLEDLRREKHPPETREDKQPPSAEKPKVDTEDKRQRHVPSRKPKPDPPKEELKKMRHVEPLRKENPLEELKKQEDLRKDRNREESRHERPVGTPHRERTLSETRTERPAEKALFERRGVLDSSVLYPTRFPSPPRPARPPMPVKRPSLDTKKDRKDGRDSSTQHPRPPAPQPASPPVKRPAVEVKKERSGVLCGVSAELVQARAELRTIACFFFYTRKVPADPNAPIAPLPFHLHPPPLRKEPPDPNAPLPPLPLHLHPPPPAKRPSVDGKKDKDSRKSITDSKPPTQRKSADCEKKDRKDSVDGKVSKKHSDKAKRERKDSSDSKSPPPKKPTPEVKKEKHRKDSCDSKPGQLFYRSFSTDSKPDRRESTDSKKSSSPPAKKLTGERRESFGSKPPPAHPQRKASTDSIERKSRTEAPRTPTTPTSPMSPSFSSAGGPLPPHLATGDSVRDKCIEMVAAALRTDNDFKDFGVNCDSMAAEIEDHIYQEIRATDMKYKNRVRSRISNLKDPKNPGLRRNVLAGSIELSRIASMSAEEMASDELKQLRNVLTQEAIREHQMAKTGGTTTDLLQCGKCKKKNCTYNQVQTRSADEPMTTFVLCNECGNRWKFC